MPPPNQLCPVQINLVLKWQDGTFGFFAWNTTETPEDQKLASLFVPGISFAKFLGNLPITFENATPPFSITSPFIILNSPFFHLCFLNFALEPYSFSMSSTLLQINFCKLINHSFVKFF